MAAELPHIVHAISKEEIEQILDFVRKTGHLPDGSDPTEGDIDIYLDKDGNLSIDGAEFILDQKDDLAVRTKDGKTKTFHVDDAENMVFYL